MSEATQGRLKPLPIIVKAGSNLVDAQAGKGEVKHNGFGYLHLLRHGKDFLKNQLSPSRFLHMVLGAPDEVYKTDSGRVMLVKNLPKNKGAVIVQLHQTGDAYSAATAIVERPTYDWMKRNQLLWKRSEPASPVAQPSQLTLEAQQADVTRRPLSSQDGNKHDPNSQQLPWKRSEPASPSLNNTPNLTLGSQHADHTRLPASSQDGNASGYKTQDAVDSTPLAKEPSNAIVKDDQAGRHAHDERGNSGINPGFIARNVLGRDRSAVSTQPPGETLRGNTAARKAEFSRLLAGTSFGELSFDSSRLGKPLDSAGEHVVFSADSPIDGNRVFKVTHPDRAGVTSRALKLRDGTVKVMQDDALPSEYLDRWQLHNELFGNNVKVEGTVASPHGASLVISQPIVKGSHPEPEEIAATLRARGWRPTGDGHWQIEHEGQTIGLADTKPANFIKTALGAIYSIDTVPFVATRAMKDHWQRLHTD